jgi:thioredoxin reductase (NADPH)
MRDVTIIGTGPAGLTAGIYAARAGLKPVIFAGLQHGGQLTTTTDVENFPGFREGIMGPKLMEDMTEQAKRVGAEIVYKQITKTDLSKRPFTLWSDGEEFQTKSLIIATGATAKTLGLPNESALMGRGLSTCATCDGFFYKGKKTVVVGGGDSAMEEATYLANICEEVVLVHRRDYFRASKIMVERAKNHPKIKFKVPYSIEKCIEGPQGVEGVVLVHQETGEKEEYHAPGVFMAIGHKPNSDIVTDFVDTDEHGYIKTTEHTATNVPGVFSAGDISDSVFRQAITAAGLGCQAAIQAGRFLESEHD